MQRWFRTITATRVVQTLTLVGDLLNVASPIVPAEHKVQVGVCLGMIHVLVNELAHRSNPDGSPVAAGESSPPRS